MRRRLQTMVITAAFLFRRPQEASPSKGGGRIFFAYRMVQPSRYV